MMSWKKAALGALAASAAATGLQAQGEARYAVQLSGLHAALSGESFEGLKSGLGFEAQGRLNLGYFSLGAGYQRTGHSSHQSGSNMTLSGLFIEPRYIVAQFSRYAPYLSVRYSILKQSYDARTFSGSTSGQTINAGGGVLVPVGLRVNIDAGVTYGYSTFKAADAVDRDSHAQFALPSGAGSDLVTRLGVSIGIGKVSH
jgi:hypothetical protein